MTATEARTNWSEVLGRVKPTGKPVTITMHEVPVAKVMPVDAVPKRPLGEALKGKLEGIEIEPR